MSTTRMLCLCVIMHIAYNTVKSVMLRFAFHKFLTSKLVDNVILINPTRLLVGFLKKIT